jgi:hypothetical protein
MFICTLSNSNDIFIKKKYFKKRKKKKRKKRLFNSDRENKFYFESFINIMLFIIEDVSILTLNRKSQKIPKV